METIGLRELNQNPSKVVARVRAGASIVVTDRGTPVLRMIPEPEPTTTLTQMVAAGSVRPPVEDGMPDLLPEIASGGSDLSAVLLADRERDRRR